MSTAARPLDHVGLVVPDLDEGVAWYTEVIGLRVLWSTRPLETEGTALGMPGDHVRIQGALLSGDGGVLLELHRYFSPPGRERSRRPSDTGYSHLTFQTADLSAQFARLEAAGMTFLGEPHDAPDDEPAGHHWVRGTDPFGTIVELRSPAAAGGPGGAGDLSLRGAGLVVDDLDRAATWYSRMFGWPLRSAADARKVDGPALGLGNGVVEVSSRSLEAGGAVIELHELDGLTTTARRRACDEGLGHIAVFADDLDEAHRRCRDAGMHFFADPRPLSGGALPGFAWTYGLDPWGDLIELITHPQPVPPYPRSSGE